MFSMVLACCYAIARLKFVLAHFYVVLWTLQRGSKMVFFNYSIWVFLVALGGS